jgi:ubiquitin-protein ligase
MPLNFQPLSMMELRGAPGEVLDRVAQNGEAFIVERSGHRMACLVPLSSFMPDIQPARLAREFEQLQLQKEWYSPSINDERELEVQFREEGAEQSIKLTIQLPHGYPSACPKVFATPVPDECPHRWQDGSLCIFGAMEMWNPGKHDLSYVLRLARRWLANFAAWRRTGEWGEETNGE